MAKNVAQLKQNSMTSLKARPDSSLLMKNQ